jgi:uncharacterized protein (TIGR02466 family)
MNHIIKCIFPTPLYKSSLERELTEKEIDFIKKIQNKLVLNKGNKTSIDNFILNNKILKKLKKDIYNKVEDYFNRVIIPNNNIKPYITQSWVNITDEGGYHHKHDHPNSIISGVFYLSSDYITFEKREYQAIQINVKKVTDLNCFSYILPVFKNEVILFPSNTLHYVSDYNQKTQRISLAFNVFVKGKIGSNLKLTELNL